MYTGEYAVPSPSLTGEKLYLNDDFADFHFIFNSKNGQLERIPAHKVLLAISSEVFQAMFNGSWKDKNEIEINDVSSDAFKEFLQFFYLLRAKITMKNLSEVMSLAKKYKVVECFSMCGIFLNENYTNDDICFVYEIAVHMEHKALEKQCAEYIRSNTRAIFASNSFLKCGRETVKRILQMDKLNCLKIEELTALQMWMRTKIAPEELTYRIIRERFWDIFHEIQHGSMTSNQFNSFDPLGLFTTDEILKAAQITRMEQFRRGLFEATHQNSSWRIQSNGNALVDCDRFEELSNEPYFIKNIETTTFTTTKLVALGAFICPSLYEHRKYGFDYATEQLQSEITIFENYLKSYTSSSKKVVLYQGTVNIQGNDVTRFLLPKPITIRPGYRYEIQMKHSPTKTYCTRVELKTTVTVEPDFNVRFYCGSFILEKATRGLISNLEFDRID